MSHKAETRPLAVASGGTGAAAADAARTSLEVDVEMAYSTVADADHSVQSHGQEIVGYTSLTTVRNVNLPAASSVPPGARLIVKDQSGSATTVPPPKTIDVTPNGADTIDGVAAAQKITTAYGSKTYYCDGVSGWWSW